MDEMRYKPGSGEGKKPPRKAAGGKVRVIRRGRRGFGVFVMGTALMVAGLVLIFALMPAFSVTVKEFTSDMDFSSHRYRTYQPGDKVYFRGTITLKQPTAEYPPYKWIFEFDGDGVIDDRDVFLLSKEGISYGVGDAIVLQVEIVEVTWHGHVEDRMRLISVFPQAAFYMPGIIIGAMGEIFMMVGYFLMRRNAEGKTGSLMVRPLADEADGFKGPVVEEIRGVPPGKP